MWHTCLHCTAECQVHPNRSHQTSWCGGTHRIVQVLQTFIEGFGVYGPLLSQVKEAFDQAIEGGLRDALESSKLRLQLQGARQQQATAEAEARAEIIDSKHPHFFSQQDAAASYVMPVWLPAVHLWCTYICQHLHVIPCYTPKCCTCATATLLTPILPAASLSSGATSAFRYAHCALPPAAGEAPQRQELYHRIATAQARLAAAQQRRNLAAKDLNRAKQELERLRVLAKGSKATKQRLVESAAAEAEWLARPGAAGILGITAGPLSKQVGAGMPQPQLRSSKLPAGLLSPLG